MLIPPDPTLEALARIVRGSGGNGAILSRCAAVLRGLAFHDLPAHEIQMQLSQLGTECAERLKPSQLPRVGDALGDIGPLPKQRRG